MVSAILRSVNRNTKTALMGFWADALYQCGWADALLEHAERKRMGIARHRVSA